MIDVNVNNIFFKSYSVDPNTGHSIYVFDSTYLPSPEEIGDKQVYDLLIDQLMDTLIAKLPSAPYSLVVFSSGFSKKKISWVYGIKMYSKLPTEARVFLQKTYIVHESFFIRSVYQVLSNAMNIKFLGSGLNSSNLDSSCANEDTSAPLVHVSDLSSLSHLIDITRLRISLNVYLHDYEISEYIEVPEEYFGRLTTLGTRQYKQLIFDKIFKRLRIEGVTNEVVFQKPGSYKKVNILLDIIERSNYIDLSQWDIYSLASIFLHFLKNKSKPLIPIDLILLPISDDYDYTHSTFLKIINYNRYYELITAIFPLFINMIKSSDLTKHDTRTLSKALAPTLCKEKISMMSSDKLSIGTRFIRNLLDHFETIHNSIEPSRMGRPPDSKQITASTSLTSPVQKERPPLQLPPQQRIISQPVPPILPKPRKLSPGKYDTAGSSRSASRDNSPTRTQPLLPERRRTASSTSLGQTLSLFNSDSTPILIPRNPSISVRIISDPSTILSNENITSGITSKKTCSSSSVPPPDTITEMVQDQPSTESNAEINKILMETNKLTLETNEKILKFDRELKKKKKQNEISISNTSIKFSNDGFSGIKSENKVSKLAALYEERLQGIQVMNDLQRKMNIP